MRARFAIVAILLGLISTTAVAHAQDGPPGLAPASGQVSSAAPQEPRREYYGWQVMLADATSMALLLNDGEGAVLGLGGYALGGPLVHAAHGNFDKTLASVLLRGGLPVLGFFVGVALYEEDTSSCDEDYGCDDPWGALGAGVAVGALGVVTAVMIDWLALGWDERPAPPATGRSLVVVPQVGVSENGASLGVLGRF